MTSRVAQPDTDADLELRACLDLRPPRSCMMVAGAGSGKTTSLVKALDRIRTSRGAELRRCRQRVACITYTELAAREIWGEVGSSPMFHVSTIHSFLWTVIRPFREDLREWVKGTIDRKIARYEERIANPRTRAATRESLQRKVEQRVEEREALADVSAFTYGVGSDYARGVLGHADILKGGSDLLHQYPLLRAVVARRFPIIFVDESQDTDPNFVDALRQVSEDEPTVWLGFFGDPMQKIYPAGVGRIECPGDWIEIKKPENFRCSQRVLSVINRIRADDDGLEQIGGGRVTELEGTARIFILPTDGRRTQRVASVRAWLAAKAEDDLWLKNDKVRILVLVHRMAALRLGFPGVYAALNDHGPSPLKDGLVDGTAWVLHPFLRELLPLMAAAESGDEFGVIDRLRQTCPRLSAERVTAGALAEIGAAVEALATMFRTGSNSTVREVLDAVSSSETLTLDSRFSRHLCDTGTGDDQPEDDIVKAYLDCPATELLGYREYLEQRSPFATHQGVKGAEFTRVLVILDDDEGPHPHFSYGKYFGYVPLSATDRANRESGKDSALERTRRLFYVCCSRAERDLAVILFSPDVDQARELVIEKNIFAEEDVHGLADLAGH